MEQLTVKALFNLEETIAKDIFENVTYPWEVLPKIGSFIVELGNSLSDEEYDKVAENVWIAKTAKVAVIAESIRQMDKTIASAFFEKRLNVVFILFPPREKLLFQHIIIIIYISIIFGGHLICLKKLLQLHFASHLYAL